MEGLKAKITNFKEKSNYIHIKLIGERWSFIRSVQSRIFNIKNSTFRMIKRRNWDEKTNKEIMQIYFILVKNISFLVKRDLWMINAMSKTKANKNHVIELLILKIQVVCLLMTFRDGNRKNILDMEFKILEYKRHLIFQE